MKRPDPPVHRVDGALVDDHVRIVVDIYRPGCADAFRVLDIPLDCVLTFREEPGSTVKARVLCGARELAQAVREAL